MTFQIVKRYGHERGLSSVFRQHRAPSHCAQLHGYALAFEFTLEADTLDENGWVFDFGRFKAIKAWLEAMFDHKLLVAQDDPQLDEITALAGLGIADVIVLPQGVGCERFAELAFSRMVEELRLQGQSDRVRVVRVAVSEHDGNGAVCTWTQ